MKESLYGGRDLAKAASRLQTTREGQLKGKIPYMAVEQLGGGTITRVTDVFAAGVVLWEALTCRRLFRGDSDIDLFRAVIEAPILGITASTFLSSRPP